MTPPQPCECWKDDPLHGLDIVDSIERAASLIADGFRQKECPSCGQFTLWIKGG